MPPLQDRAAESDPLDEDPEAVCWMHQLLERMQGLCAPSAARDDKEHRSTLRTLWVASRLRQDGEVPMEVVRERKLSQQR